MTVKIQKKKHIGSQAEGCGFKSWLANLNSQIRVRAITFQIYHELW